MTLKYSSISPTPVSLQYYPLGHSAAEDVPMAVMAPTMQDWFVTGRSFNATSLDNCITVRYFDPNP